MSSNPILTIAQREDGQYYATYLGEEFWVLTQPTLVDYHFDGYLTEVHMDLRMVYLPKPKPKKPKRTVARSLGLRRPDANR